MARYSPSDNYKRAQDKVHELRERGILDVRSVRDVKALHPGGLNAALDKMLAQPSATRDQSQQQREEGKERAKKNMERLKSKKKK